MIIREGIEDESGIIIFDLGITENHEDFHATELDRLYAVEEKYFWFIAKKKRIIDIFQKYVQKNESILEIGAGTGNIAYTLEKAFYSDVSVGDIHLKGLRYAKNYGIKNCYQFDLFNPPFSEHFDVIGLFDVLEHLEDDVLALKCARSMLKQNGRIILTVPAHQWLWNRHDTIMSHKRRYTLRKLESTLQQAGFKILYAHYFFISILPLLLLRRILEADNGNKVEEKEHYQKISINPIINHILLKICMLENRFIDWMPNLAGGSIILVCENQNF